MDSTVGAMLTVLLVAAQPDDETLFGGFMHALTRKLNASVDLMCVTNGEGGFLDRSQCLNPSIVI